MYGYSTTNTDNVNSIGLHIEPFIVPDENPYNRGNI